MIALSMCVSQLRTVESFTVFDCLDVSSTPFSIFNFPAENMNLCAFIIIFSLGGALHAQKIVKFGNNNRISFINYVKKILEIFFVR